LIEAANTIPILRLRNQAADHLISRNQGARNVLAGQGVQFLDRSPALATSRPYLAIAATAAAMVGIFFATQIVSNQIQSLSDKAKASAHGIYLYCRPRLAPRRRVHKQNNRMKYEPSLKGFLV
jgi:hypothetical protein